jgi:hypothetical protein
MLGSLVKLGADGEEAQTRREQPRVARHLFGDGSPVGKEPAPGKDWLRCLEKVLVGERPETPVADHDVI